jgi:hypothetical protein
VALEAADPAHHKEDDGRQYHEEAQQNATRSEQPAHATAFALS